MKKTYNDITIKKNYDMEVEVVQKASTAVVEKAASDTGLEASDLIPVTDLTDFKITIADSKNHGSIVSTTFVLPDDTLNPKYLKKNTPGEQLKEREREAKKKWNMKDGLVMCAAYCFFLVVAIL